MRNKIWTLAALLVVFPAAPGAWAADAAPSPPDAVGPASAPQPAAAPTVSAAPAGPMAAACDGCAQMPNCNCGCDCGCDCCGPGTNPWDGTLKVGAGLRTSFSHIDQNTLTGPHDYNFFNPDDMRIYLSGTAFGGVIKGTLNTEVAGGGTFVSPDDVTQVRLLDGIAQWEAGDLFNVWIGRFLPPSDRANLDGPFYQTPYDYPFVSNFPAIFAGRDDGAAYWGQVGGGQFKWQLGVFNGIGRNYDGNGDAIGPNLNGDMLYAARFTLNLLDPEPGYYTQSSYYGAKEILAIGVVFQGQKNGAGVPGAPADFDGQEIDVLYEHKFANCGVLDIEGAYYNFDYGGVPSVGRTLNQGDSGYVEISYLMPREFGFGRVSGKFQPFGRYQNYNRDFGAAAAALSTTASPVFNQEFDFGFNYVVSGYNARYTAAWEEYDVQGGGNFNVLRIGAQLQF